MGLYVLKYRYGRLLEPLSAALAWLHPDVLSYLATAVAIATGACYLGAADRSGLLLLAIGLTGLRMTLNTLDGAIAIRRGDLSLKGEVVNALPDRYSDVFVVVGIALCPLCRPLWGILGLSSMLLVSYAGMLGKALGVDWQHHGPMGKVERLVCLMVFSLIQFFRLRGGSAAWTVLGWSVTPLECCMVLFVVLGQVTVLDRVRGMLRQIARAEWRKAPGRGGLPGRVLVAYDSVTGNTRKVAVAIAECLQADLERVTAVRDPEGYDLVVIGSPTISGGPTEKVMRFLRDHPGLRSYAAFVTYGAPGWGPISARKCFAVLARTVGTAPLATFACKGFHARFKTYRGRPDDRDLLMAFLFGIKLARTVGRRSWTTNRSAGRSCG